MKTTRLYGLLAMLSVGMLACNEPNDPIIDEDLLGVVWRVDTLWTPEEEIVPGLDTLMTMEFNEDLKINVDTPCNAYAGTYAISTYGKIAIEWQIWTEMACLQGSAARRGILESRFIQTLNNASGYAVTDSALSLYDSDLRWVVNLKNE